MRRAERRETHDTIDATGDGPVQRMQKKIARVVFFCFQCCIWCLEKCMKFINKEAYNQTAIIGQIAIGQGALSEIFKLRTGKTTALASGPLRSWNAGSWPMQSQDAGS